MKKIKLDLPTLNRQSSENKPVPPLDLLDLEEIKCPHCRDGQFLHPLLEDGKPDYSTVVPCRYCMSTETIRRSLGISSLDSTFDNFKIVEGAEDAFKAAKLIATLETNWKLLLIYGRWGNGKTHLLEAIAITIWNKGMSARIHTFPEFMERLKDTFDCNRDDDDSFKNIMAQFCSVPFLLLDDVGVAGSFTPFSLSQLERIMLSRYRDNLLTVVTTNLDKDELPRFVISRFNDAEKARMVLNEAEDYRPKKKTK